jgi:membrane dipeptidase
MLSRATLLALVASVAGAASLAAQGAQPLRTADLATRLAHVRTLLRDVPLVDGHNDLPWAMRQYANAPLDVAAYDLTKPTPGHTDLARLRTGGIGGQFWSVYIPAIAQDSGAARVQLEQIDVARRTIARYPDAFRWALTAQAVRDAHREGRIGSLLGMEGGHAIENSLGALRAFYDLGVRYMTLTHSATIDWADAGTDVARHGGLTAFGEEVVREMNRLGMLVDLSHTSPGTMSDALNVTEAPVIFSHSNARALTDVPRNVPDSILRRLPQNGGVVMVTFVPGFSSQRVADWSNRLAQATAAAGSDTDAQFRAAAAFREANPLPRAQLGDVADHLDHIKRVAGAAHVGLGGDFDGITDVVQGLEDVAKYPELLAELVRRGWTDDELRGLAGNNVLRVLERAEQVAARLQRERPASTKTIPQLDARPTP